MKYIFKYKEPLVEIFQHKGSSECAINSMIPYVILSNYPTKILNQNFRMIFPQPPKSSFVRDALNKDYLFKKRKY